MLLVYIKLILKEFFAYVSSFKLTGIISSAIIILLIMQTFNVSSALSSLPRIKDGDYLLALVTKETYLGKYAPRDLVRIPSYLSSREIHLRKEANNSLVKMYNAARSDGVTLLALSAYRSYSYQKQLFDNYAARHGEREANRFSARPGQSEHQLGTAVDFGGTGADWSSGFADTAAGRWLRNNAHKYGFVMSYPSGSESITGYIYEPWHYRYIGVDNAEEWQKSGLVLSEYLKTKPQYYSNHPDNIPVTSVKLNKQSATIHIGEKLTLSPSFTPADATNRKVNWESDNKEVATVDSRGRVTGVGEGKATITVITKDGNKKAKCVVTVKYIKVNSVSLNKNELILATNDVITLEASVLPENATNKDLAWESDNPDVAAVDEGGTVTVQDVGEATITVTSQCSGMQDRCHIEVPYVAPESVTLNHYEYVLYLNGMRNKLQLKENIKPANTSCPDVIWHTANRNIAKVDRGLVTAAGEGEVTIIVQTLDGALTAVCHIEVVDDGITYGDVNDDGIINVEDAILILRHIVGISHLEDDNLKAARVTTDSETITVSDAIAVLRHIVDL